MHQRPFFNTQHEQQLISPRKTETLLHKKTELGTYVSNLDHHINKAMNFQNRIILRKKQNLLNTLEKMKDQVYKESQKTRKMEEFFYLHCEKILNDDINKWDGNMDFFKKLFQAYDFKIKQKRRDIENKKVQIEQKTTQLKQLLKSLRKTPTISEFATSLSKKHIPTEQTTDRLTRIKTQSSLPSLSRQQRLKTLGDSEDQDIKNYMRPIKTQKNIEKVNSSRFCMMEMLEWYRDSRGFQKRKLQKSNLQTENWFQKVIFVERNYRKIKDWVANVDSQ